MSAMSVRPDRIQRPLQNGREGDIIQDGWWVGASILMRVHVACDDEPVRQAVAGALIEDELVDCIYESRAGEAGAIALYDARPDVTILAVPPNASTFKHAMVYRQAAKGETALLGLCLIEDQDEEYRLAGIETIEYLSSATAHSMREKVRTAYRTMYDGLLQK